MTCTAFSQKCPSSSFPSEHDKLIQESYSIDMEFAKYESDKEKLTLEHRNRVLISATNRTAALAKAVKELSIKAGLSDSNDKLTSLNEELKKLSVDQSRISIDHSIRAYAAASKQIKSYVDGQMADLAEVRRRCYSPGIVPSGSGAK